MFFPINIEDTTHRYYSLQDVEGKKIKTSKSLEEIEIYHSTLEEKEKYKIYEHIVV